MLAIAHKFPQSAALRLIGDFMALQDQPAYIIKMRAKPGLGDKLFELASAGMTKSGASDRFIIAREDGDPDILWNVEVFISEEAKANYENSPLADELRDEIISLLAEPPMRIPVHPYAALPIDES
ncbi:MAG: antibiotic biosynthesis monooxygenase [Oceanospirillaceae bacterium]|nr:antibiotic biosynthesis monooxygenase [Oceanospirillaceae bacterium]